MGVEIQPIIRLACANDLQAVTAIYNWAVTRTVATFDLEERSPEAAWEWFQVHQDPFYPLYVVENNGKVSGWGSLSPFHPRPAYRLTGEFSIYLHPDRQGRGLGTLLLERLCWAAADIGYHSLIGLITASNCASLRLAAKCGFVEVGRYREVGRKFGQWLDVIAVQKMFAVKETAG